MCTHRSTLRAALTVAAAHADARSKRHATTFPMLSALTASAITAELTRLAAEHEELIRTLGREHRSILRTVAKHVPAVVDKAVKTSVAADAAMSSGLLRLADLAGRERNSPPK